MSSEELTVHILSCLCLRSPPGLLAKEAKPPVLFGRGDGGGLGGGTRGPSTFLLGTTLTTWCRKISLIDDTRKSLNYSVVSDYKCGKYMY